MGPEMPIAAEHDDQRPGCQAVYVIGADIPPYKIGISSDPLARLRHLQVASPLLLSLWFSRALPSNRSATKIEACIHRRLKASHVRGEWFDLPVDKLSKVITQVIEGWPATATKSRSTIGLKAINLRYGLDLHHWRNPLDAIDPDIIRVR